MKAIHSPVARSDRLVARHRLPAVVLEHHFDTDVGELFVDRPVPSLGLFWSTTTTCRAGTRPLACGAARALAAGARTGRGWAARR